MNTSAAAVMIADLPRAWAARAELLRRHGAREAADAITTLAEELQNALRDQQDAVLTLAEAAAEGGYAVDTLSRMIRDGRLANVGRKHAPRIRRGDVPRRAGALPFSSEMGNMGDARRRAVRASIAAK